MAKLAIIFYSLVIKSLLSGDRAFFGVKMKTPIITPTMLDYILFHPLKHHLHFLKDWLHKNAGQVNDTTITAIKTLGSSQLDMYCGHLAVYEILQEVSNHLDEQGITDTTTYHEWVQDDYKLCTLSDDSTFTLRFIDHEKPVHIHPARNVPFTIRIKANALKTVAIYILAYGFEKKHIDVVEMNNLRVKFLELSPVADKADVSEMEKVWGMMRE